jgi:hypothetical protein
MNKGKGKISRNLPMRKHKAIRNRDELTAENVERT